MKIGIKTPQEQLALKNFTGKLAHYLNEEIQKVSGEFDYGMVCVPLVALAVQALKARGMDKDDIEQAILQTMDQQFKSDTPSLILLPGGKR